MAAKQGFLMYYSKGDAIGTKVSVRYRSGRLSGVVVKRGSTVVVYYMYTCIDKTMQIVLERGSIDGMPNTYAYACKGVSNPNVPIFPRGFAL